MLLPSGTNIPSEFGRGLSIEPTARSAPRVASLDLMAELPRFIPSGGATVEISSRTVQGRYLLRPGRRLNRIAAGVLGRSQRIYGVQIHDFRILSNHFHLLLSVETAQQLASFMNYFKSNLAREAGRLHHWTGPFWNRRYDLVLVWNDEIDQISRLRYLLRNGCKEGLVASPLGWPGLHGTNTLVSGQLIRGVWINRTRWHRAPLAERKHPERFEEIETVVLSPLPCWRHLSPTLYRLRVAQLIREIELETALMHRQNGTRPAGRRRICRLRPHHKPAELERSPKPRFHCRSKAAREALYAALSDFCRAYRAAAERLKAGELDVCFPEGAFPPPAPFRQPIRGPA